MSMFLRLMILVALAALAFGNPAFAKNDGDKVEGEEAPETPVGTVTIHTFDMIEGIWSGTVSETGVEGTYTITMTMRASGAGEVHYLGAGYDCRGVLAPHSAGVELVFIETIVMARDQCADGVVRVTLDGDRMEWRWINEYQEVQATANLARKR